MKILFLSNIESIHTIRWVNTLAEKEIEVYLVSQPSPNAECVAKKLNPKIKIFLLKYSGIQGYYLNYMQLRKIFKMIQPDLVNAHYASGYGTLARLARLSPLLLSVWGSDIYLFPQKSVIHKTVIKKNLTHANAIASTSACMAAKVNEIMDKDMECKITPFGVDTFLFKSECDLKLKKEKFVFGIVKTLAPVYGIDTVIKAYGKFLILNEKHKDNTVLDIYGDGRDKKRLIDLTEKLGIKNNVNFKGYIDYELVPKVLNNIDVFCLGSYSESFGVAAVEAMSCKVPVIATDAEGLKEVILDKKTGFIVERGNDSMMSEKMNELYYNNDLRNDFGEESRKRVLDNYDWNNNVEEMIKIYRKLADDFN